MLSIGSVAGRQPEFRSEKGATNEGGPMSIRRRCTERSCKNGRRCLEHLRFDVMWRGKRYRMPVNEYAIPRMEPGRQRPIQSMEEARDWERRFIGEVKAGLDPQRPPSQPRNV